MRIRPIEKLVIEPNSSAKNVTIAPMKKLLANWCQKCFRYQWPCVRTPQKLSTDGTLGQIWSVNTSPSGSSEISTML